MDYHFNTKQLLVEYFYKQGRISEKDYEKWMLSEDINEPLPYIKN